MSETVVKEDRECSQRASGPAEWFSKLGMNRSHLESLRTQVPEHSAPKLESLWEWDPGTHFSVIMSYKCYSADIFKHV